MDKPRILSGVRVFYPSLKPRLDACRDSIAKFTLAISDVDKAYDDMALTLQAYRRLYPGIRRTWLRSARPKMSKRAWRRLRGKVKGLNRGIR